MRKKLLAKLQSGMGETLGETLLALLISALALTMLAGAISTALNLVTKSNEQMTKYYGGDNIIATQRTDMASGDGDTVTTTEATVTLTGSTQTFNVKCFANSAFPGTTVVSYVSYTPGD